MSYKEQTAVELLELQINIGLSDKGLTSAFKQAKEKHKKDIEKTWIASAEYAILFLQNKTSKSSKEAFEQYYNETYGNNTP